MKGLIFTIENKPEKYLYKILKDISSTENIWSVSEPDVYKKNVDSDCYMESLFTKNIYTDLEFFETINEISYVIFCNIKLYNTSSEIYEIESVEDFLSSQCELILLITDNIYVEIYSKKEIYLDVIKKNLLEMGIKDFSWKNINDRLTMFAQGD